MPDTQIRIFNHATSCRDITTCSAVLAGTGNDVQNHADLKLTPNIYNRKNTSKYHAGTDVGHLFYKIVLKKYFNWSVLSLLAFALLNVL